MWRSDAFVRSSRETRRANSVLTPSVIFVRKNGKPALVQCGDVLGDMTSELKENEYISEFVSGGPKNCL